MPYHKNFDELDLRGTFSVTPIGWKPLIIEYGYDKIGGADFFFWRVADTKHTFRKPVSSLNQESGGDYETHIKEFLEGFREEMLGWLMEGIDTEWSRDYFREYNRWVII
jgi:hypothetical protein